ncbi:V-set and immunoglobulin domain-containing protein 10-like isoform X2 [Micropterus dolomieu]|uniref:V-set and immunoglobulin domain-containing protein 10-like isoform X2 n=1 Tax=Micropterus dolomieu TaxID=147949 RepID=UPI001E8E4648|nr:V-set and immunoglobulin domain-containing protein 10-like isoform X2 [Micropterus dolomieu]
MTWLDACGRLIAVFLAFLLKLTFQGAYCKLEVSPAGPAPVNAISGSNVTLAVSFSGAHDPVVTWFMKDLPVLTWTINSPSPPDIAKNYSKVLRIAPHGSLTFVNVSLGYTSNYTIEITKSGLGKASTTFTLKVFENIQNVILSAQTDFAQEGTDRLTLQYSMLQGVVEEQMWFFNGIEINTNSHYLLEQQSLVILKPNRSDTGQYTVLLKNPFNSVTTDINVTVLYGPDEPKLEAYPAQPFYISGDYLSLSCQAEGFPQPTVEWVFGGQTLSGSHRGVLNLTYVQTSQGGVYTCTLLNEQTKQQRRKDMTLNVYERPLDNPMCSVHSVNNVDLQYECWWLGGTPQAKLSFPALSNTSSGAETFSLTFTASDNLNGKTVTCVADHPIEQNMCNITARSPMDVLPAVSTTVDSEGKIMVTIYCVSDASPVAVVSWSKDSEAVTSGTTYHISSDTTQFKIRDYNISNFLLHNYTCTCHNPLGSHGREIQLRGPSISNSSLFPNQNGTIATLMWEVPPTSVVTGFDIQMKGPDLLSKDGYGTQTRVSSNKFHTIQQRPGSDRSTDIFDLDPMSTYMFRIIPKARMTEGEPSEVQIIGPVILDEGLRGPAIAAGIPSSLLLLLLLGGFIFLCVYCNKNKRRPQTRYPVCRAVEKAVTTQIDTTPCNLLSGGLASAPDYNMLQQTPSERSVTLPTFVPPPPVRVATTV